MDQQRLKRFAKTLAAGGIFSLLSATVAFGGTITSTYTDLNTINGESNCETLGASKPDEGGEWANVRCPGPGGVQIYIDYADARDALRVGKEGAATPFLSAFTGFGPKAEWRMKDGKPFAMIIRMKLGGVAEGNWLTVHRTPGSGMDGCLIGYVDARANRNANVLARELADAHATAKCGQMPLKSRGNVGKVMNDLVGPLTSG